MYHVGKDGEENGEEWRMKMEHRGYGIESGGNSCILYIVLCFYSTLPFLHFSFFHFFIFCNFPYLSRIPDAWWGSYQKLLAVPRSGCP